MRVRVLPVPQCPAGWAGTSSTSRRSGADLSASGRGGESRSPCPRHYGVERAPSQSLGIHFDSRTYWFEPGVRADGRLFLWSWWAVDSAGGTKPAKPSGPGFLRGALPGRVLFPGVGVVGAERRRAGQRFRVDDCYGWPSGASHDRTAPRVGKRGAPGQHVSVDVSVLLLGTLLSFSAHSFLIGWLLEYSVMLV